MEDVAIQIGLDLIYYWQLTPYQLNKHISAYNNKLQADYNLYDEIAFTIGIYVMKGFHDPENYPTLPISQSTQKTNEKMSDADMEKMARRNTIRTGGEII